MCLYLFQQYWSFASQYWNDFPNLILFFDDLLRLKAPLEEDNEDISDAHAEHGPPETGTPSNYGPEFFGLHKSLHCIYISQVHISLHGGLPQHLTDHEHQQDHLTESNTRHGSLVEVNQAILAW